MLGYQWSAIPRVRCATLSATLLASRYGEIVRGRLGRSVRICRLSCFLCRCGLPAPSEGLRPNGEEGRWARVREVWHALVLGFKHNDLLTYASATSFQILTAIIPFLMFVLAIMQLLHANSVWHNHVEPFFIVSVTT